MGSYGLAWILILVMAVGGGTTLWFLLKSWRSVVLKSVLVAAAVLFFITPAGVPRFEDTFAPVFIIALFELFFQIDGSPRGALVILGLSLFLGVLLTAAVAWKFRTKSPSEGKRKGKSAGKQDPVAN